MSRSPDEEGKPPEDCGFIAPSEFEKAFFGDGYWRSLAPMGTAGNRASKSLLRPIARNWSKWGTITGAIISGYAVGH